MVVLGYLPKLKSCLGLAFGERFLYAFYKLNVISFFLLNIKQNMLLSSYLENC